MFEIYIFVPAGKAVKSPSYKTDDPAEAAKVTDMLLQLYDKKIIDYLYVFFNKQCIEYYER